MINNEDGKRIIAERLGIPENLLTGHTVEDNLKIARALVEYRAENATAPSVEPSKTTREQFADWFTSVSGSGLHQAAGEYEQALNVLEAELTPSYPVVRDGGEVANMPDLRDPRKQFEEWFADVSAVDLGELL